jgi:hypothetical protein
MMVNTLQILFLTESLLITSSGLFAGHVPRAFLTPNATPNYLGRMMGMSACGRYCCKKILRIWASNIDSTSGTQAQR